jgi:hypothetical protein
MLHVAVNGGFVSASKLLISQGADPLHPDEVSREQFAAQRHPSRPLNCSTSTASVLNRAGNARFAGWHAADTLRSGCRCCQGRRSSVGRSSCSQKLQSLIRRTIGAFHNRWQGASSSSGLHDGQASRLDPRTSS